MDVWSKFETRIKTHGDTKRESFLLREKHMLETKLKDSLSFYNLVADDVETELAIVGTDNLNEKFVYSITGDDFYAGSLIEWMDTFWLVTEVDASREVYTKGKMLQCNHLLKWIDNNGVIHNQWCIIEDGTKYLTGEFEDRKFVVTRGDSRIAMTIAKNNFTANFGREHRFLIDDPDSGDKLSYILTKPFKRGFVYEKGGVYRFVLSETMSTDDDNHDLGIADYYKYFPKEEQGFEDAKKPVIDPENTISNNGKKVWL